MRIYTRADDLAFKTFTFPDGQPHFKLETYDREFQDVVIESAIKSPSDLFTILMVNQVLRDHGYSEVRLDIRYLLGARMDRAISYGEPFTLGLVSRLINGAGFSKVRILDVHSEVATRLIRNSENVLPTQAVWQVRQTLGHPVIVCPDKGAIDRVTDLCGAWPTVYCSKKRDPNTGTLTGFSVDVQEGPGRCYSPFDGLIIDDICDGGGTFVGLAKELRKAGAKKVYLFVTHGIFSKGTPLEGIDHIYTTDSYAPSGNVGATMHRLGVCGDWKVTTIPISMKEL